MLYHAYEMSHAAITPMRTAARMSNEIIRFPFNPLSQTYGSRALSAAFEMFIDATRRYAKPEFGIESIEIDGVETPVVEEIVWSRAFCNLLHFSRNTPGARKRKDPTVLIVAPMSGHYATLLRGTVRAMLPDHDVYITDWIDAREVPLTKGAFDLDDYTDYLMAMIRHLSISGQRIAVMAVCQPGIPALAAASLMAEAGDPARPASLVLMGSPIDTSRNPKKPNELAQSRPLSWFENNVIVRVPWPNMGFMRRVYPGFLQLQGFMSMNLDRHVDAHLTQYRHLMRGDGDGAIAHRKFYDEYMAVMDLTAEFYLQTIDRVFQKRLMARNAYFHRMTPVLPAAIEDIGLMTIEGGKDDITGLGQTEAAHDLVTNLPAGKRLHFPVPEVGHYGVFNGSRWRGKIQPAVREFIRANRETVKG